MVLRSDPYSYELGDLVQAKVRAENAVGFSEYSQENNVGATIQIEPSQVQGLSLNYELSTNTKMVL